jgi:hypothetical protein
MTKFLDIKYFQYGNGVCGEDFKNKPMRIRLNRDHITSLTELMDFRLPFSGEHVGAYAILTMLTGEKYYIFHSQYESIKDIL